jgi:hypothetical protein
MTYAIIAAMTAKMTFFVRNAAKTCANAVVDMLVRSIKLGAHRSLKQGYSMVSTQEQRVTFEIDHAVTNSTSAAEQAASG